MKLSIKIAAVIACVLPLTACEGTRGFFGDSTPAAHRYRPDSRPQVSTAVPANTMAVGQVRTVTKTKVVKTGSDVTMVEHGVSTSVSPKTAALVKSPNSQPRPMVPGGAPSVE